MPTAMFHSKVYKTPEEMPKSSSFYAKDKRPYYVSANAIVYSPSSDRMRIRACILPDLDAGL
jgi:hypothetical protein